MARNPLRRNRGRQRVPMQLMPIESNRAVTFSKRHSNLFKKANELCTLCGAQAAVIVSSPGEKGFAYGNPSVDIILDRYLQGDGTNPILGQRNNNPAQNDNIVNYNSQLTVLKDMYEAEKKRTDRLLEPRKSMPVEALKFLEPLDELALPELKQMLQSLTQLGDNVNMHKSLLEAQAHVMPMPMPLPRQNPIGHEQALVPSPFGHPSDTMMMSRPSVPGPYDNPPPMMVPAPLGIFDPTMIAGQSRLGGPFYNPGVFGDPSMMAGPSGLGGPLPRPGAFADPSMTMGPSGLGSGFPKPGAFGDPSMVMGPSGLEGPLPRPGAFADRPSMAMGSSGLGGPMIPGGIQGSFYDPRVYGDRAMTVRPSGTGGPLYDPNLPSSSSVPNLMGAGPSNLHPTHPTNEGQVDGRQGLTSSLGMTTGPSGRNLMSLLMDDDEDEDDDEALFASFNPQGGSCFASGSGGS